jgi:hypothetical protein
MESGAGIACALAEYTIDTERCHQELLELISSQSGSSDNAASVGLIYQGRPRRLISPNRSEGAL